VAVLNNIFLSKSGKTVCFGFAAFACIVDVKVQVAFFSFKACFHTGKRTF